QPVVFAELRFRALGVRLSDEVLVLRRLALDRGGAPVVAASLACLLGHRGPSSCGQKCRNPKELAQRGRLGARVASETRVIGYTRGHGIRVRWRDRRRPQARTEIE